MHERGRGYMKVRVYLCMHKRAWNQAGRIKLIATIHRGTTPYNAWQLHAQKGMATCATA